VESDEREAAPRVNARSLPQVNAGSLTLVSAVFGNQHSKFDI
jgi:hypothetical protein